MRFRHAGFTLIEMMVALVILSTLLAVGVPTMRSWLLSTRAVSAAEFYAEGMRMARAEALKRNVVSRLVFTPNAKSGQQDWQVDLCVPTVTVLCTPDTGTWSTVTTPLTNTGVTDFKSVFRSAASLPPTTQMTVTRIPAGADDVYFTPVGWTDASIPTNLTEVVISTGTTNAGTFPTTSVVLTGAGSVMKCSRDTTLAAADSRKCPPL